MGRGNDLAKQVSPEAANAVENMKDQLILALVRRLGGDIRVPAAEIDDTAGIVLTMSVDDSGFRFVTMHKATEKVVSGWTPKQPPAPPAAPVPPVDRTQTAASGGGPLPSNYSEITASGQQKAYVVLSDAERAKGYVRPARRSYVHVGERPAGPVRDLTPDELEQHGEYGYVKFEPNTDPERGSILGRFWTRAQLESGCGVKTTMSQDIAETYARDPKFYGSTFCTGCGRHFPVAQFKWADSETRVGD